MGFALPVMGIAGAGLSALGAYNSAEAASQDAAYEAQVACNNAIIAGENVGWTAAAGAAKGSNEAGHFSSTAGKHGCPSLCGLTSRYTQRGLGR